MFLFALASAAAQKPTFENTRLQKTELATNLDEPMELAVLPEGDVLFIERKGAVKLFENAKNQVRRLAAIPVFHGVEDGLLGLTLAPDFADSRWVYLYYSPTGSKPIQRVSRFKMEAGELNLASEQILLEIPVQREECCHSAGSLAFGPDGTLYIAVGDNTNPHNPGYYNSIDERPGREYWDAQRTAANTNDFRGKILRIKPESNGMYSIPEGNLFPKDGSGGKPEIYAMGCRNPYRIALDQKTGYLYWGDVGQNTEYNPARGPISYDEFHQAKTPGFFGWPYFAGDNQPYADYDFETNKIGSFFDPKAPVNESRNNTGSRNLPPAQGAFIWYSYDESKLFKHLGTGGKSPIAGPVFYSDSYRNTPAWAKTTRRLPAYFNGKLFIAEWMRDWINVVTMDETGKLTDIERFMPSATFDHPIDLAFGPDGALYVLEYGTFWFAQNKNARLSRVEYNPDNRPPIAVITADNTVGAAPLTVSLSARKSFDYDKEDKLTYQWKSSLAGSAKKAGPSAQYVFAKPGTYTISLTATDNHKQSATSTITVEVGNAKPQATVKITGNQSFYWPRKTIQYQAVVTDREDGSLAAGTISPADVLVTVDYLDMGSDLTFLAQSQQNAQRAYFHPGLELINKSDCRACHHPQTASVGPSYEKIAARYKSDEKMVPTLAAKIINGGNGAWGEVAMSAHPQLKQEEAAEIVKYIFTLGEDVKNRMPVKGAFVPKDTSGGVYLLGVRYRDKGHKGQNTIKSQQAATYVPLRSARLKAVTCDDYSQVAKFNNALVKFTASGSYICFRGIDLTSLARITYAVASQVHGKIEMRLRSPSGPLVGSLSVKPSKTNRLSTMPLVPTVGKQDVYLVYKDTSADKANMWVTCDLDWIEFKQ